ncbi:hypothetical protein BY996DRAFT_6457906 [Phakopsora pachyrhizi]|nr:hypothetical protein BY996DRAFT_6457906 [Phakopsora pachyrhizi]
MQEPKTRKIFEESIPSLMRIGSGSASSLVTIRNRAPSSSTHFLFQQANRPLPTLSNNLTFISDSLAISSNQVLPNIKKDQGSKGGVYGLPMIEHGDQNFIGGNEDGEKESIGHSTSKVCSQDFACYNLVAVEERDRCHTMIQRYCLQTIERYYSSRDDQTRISTLPKGVRVTTKSTPGHFIGAGAYIDAGSCYKSDRLREHQNFGLRFNPLEYIFRPTQLEATSGLNGEVKSLNELHEAVSLYDLVRTDSSDKQQSLLKPDILCGIYYHFFDAELFANSVLNNEPYHSISGSATQNLSAGDIGLVLSKLNIGIEYITKRLRSELPYMTHFSQPRLVSSRSKQMLKDYMFEFLIPSLSYIDAY